eukprot:SAG11_NODE_18260_length_496_cov_0.483627_1_plen_73_part_01
MSLVRLVLQLYGYPVQGFKVVYSPGPPKSPRLCVSYDGILLELASSFVAALRFRHAGSSGLDLGAPVLPHVGW